MLVDGPAVLGWHAWRAIDRRHGLGLMRGAFSTAAEAGRLLVPDLDAATRSLAGAMVDAAMLVAERPRDRKLRAAVADTLRALLRALVR